MKKYRRYEGLELTNEKPVEGKELLEEIYPLLGDYFEGDIRFENDRLVYSMPNGQKFYISVSES